MRYVLTIRPDSFTGQWLSKSGADGTNGGAPTMDCASVDMSHGAFLQAVRGPLNTAEGRKHQSLHIPYGDVLLILEYAKSDRALGFLAD